MVLLGFAIPGKARTLQVGPELPFKTPSAAAAAVADGDTVAIAPGTYFDCAVWTANGLTLEGTSPGVVLTDKPCEGKASFVIRGNGITVRNLSFTRIRVPDENGAGIRVEGRDFTVEHSRFINNQLGILAGNAMPSTIIIRDCDFTDNGRLDSISHSADLLIGRVTLLRIEGSTLQNGKGGAAVISDALRTEIADTRIEAGATGEPYVVGVMNGGSLVMNRDTIMLNTASLPSIGAVTVAQDDDLPAGEVTLRHTILTNRTGQPAILLRNWAGVTPSLTDNALQPGDMELSTDGYILHRLKQVAHHIVGWLQTTKAALRHVAAVLVHSLQRALT